MSLISDTCSAQNAVRMMISNSSRRVRMGNQTTNFLILIIDPSGVLCTLINQFENKMTVWSGWVRAAYSILF
jgi:hypothetical protein